MVLVMTRQPPPVLELELELEPEALAGRLVEGLVQMKAGRAGGPAVLVLPAAALVQAGLPDLAWALELPPKSTARGRGLAGRRRLAQGPAQGLAP